MRKADYALLAQRIKQGRIDAKNNQDCFAPGTPNAEYWRGTTTAYGDIAFTMAQKASVRENEFLKACGIK